jgi:hypothetical protein
MAVAIFSLAGMAACSDSTSPQDECAPDTKVVTATVTTGASVEFDWSPRCGMALVLVEENSSDRWVISTDEATWGAPSTANTIMPKLTYGEVLAGTDSDPALPLVAGRTYDLILWRSVSSITGCAQRIDDHMCLVAVKRFVR